MMYLGDYPASHTAVCIPFDSFAAATGAPSAVTNFAAGDVQIYKNGGTTQRSSSSGIVVTTGFDSLTGLQMITIDLSDNTDAGFYAAGNEYQVAVSDVTIDGQTVRFWAATFSIERAGGALALTKNGTYGLSALKALIDTLDDFVDTEVAAIKAKTDQLTFGTANRVDAQVYGVQADAITAAALAADAGTEIGTAVWGSAARTLTALDEDSTTLDLDATIRAAVGLASANLDTQVGDLPTNAELATALGTADDAVLAQVALVKAKTDNLPADPADASDIAASFVTVNSTLSTIAGYLDTEVAAIKAKTDNLPSDPADASVVAGLIAAVDAKVDTVDTVVDAIKAKTDSLTYSVAGKVDANVKAVNDITVDGAGTSGDPWGPA